MRVSQASSSKHITRIELSCVASLASTSHRLNSELCRQLSKHVTQIELLSYVTNLASMSHRLN